MRGYLPEKIIRRKKKGFGIPVSKWISGDLKDLVFDQLSPEKLKREGFFNPDYVAKLLNGHCRGLKDNRKELWVLLMFELWLEKWGKA